MTQTTILVADDDLTCRRVLQLLLTKWGYDVRAVADGSAALAGLACPNPPRLAILDWEMPGLTGPEVCRRVRAEPGAPQPYILLLTARESKEDISEGIRSGADDYLSKPLEANELRVRLGIAQGMLEKRDLEATSRELERRVEEGTAELATAHANNEQLLASIPCILVGLNADGRVTQWNRFAEDTFSLPAAGVLGRPFAGLDIQWEDPSLPARVLGCGPANRATRLEHVSFARPGGGRGVLDLTVAPVLGSRRDTLLGVLLLGEDCTEQLLLKEQLAQAQKLESIGQLAAGIAHEINTPIQYIGDNTNFLAGSFADLQTALAAYRAAADPAKLPEADAAAAAVDLDFLTADVPKAVCQTLEGVQHVARIVRAMKEFAHPGGEEKALLDLNHAIENVVIVARNEWKFVATVETDFDPDLPKVYGLPGELNQVLLNLLVNAAHAIQAGGGGHDQKGTITLATRRVGNLVELRVADTGCGIPEAIRGRVFDPFFTTKPVGQGTGQGLAIAHAVVVQRHGGTITFESDPGHGTTFVVWLPINGNRLTQSERVQVVTGGSREVCV